MSDLAERSIFTFGIVTYRIIKISSDYNDIETVFKRTTFQN